MNRSLIQWFLTIAGLSGIASIFLSFTWSVSPVEASLSVFDDFSFLSDIWILGVPFLLSVVIFASLIRWNLTGCLSLLEQIITYLIGLSMIAVVISSNFRFLSDGGRMSVIFSVSSLIAGIFLVFRNHRIGKFKNLSPIMLMQTVYLSNGIFCLIDFWGDWDLGAYFTLVTVIVYAAQMVWLSCQKKAVLTANP